MSTLIKDPKRAVKTGGAGLAGIPALVVELIATKGWEPSYATFEDFIPGELGVSFDELFRICVGGFDCLCAMDEALQSGRGKTDLAAIANHVLAPTGNSKRAAIRKVRKNATHRYEPVRKQSRANRAKGIQDGTTKSRW